MENDQQKLLSKIESLFKEIKSFKDIERAHLAKLIRNELDPFLQSIRDLKQDILNLHFQDRVSFTLQEAATITGISYTTLYNWGRSGKLEVSQPGGKKGAKIVRREVLVQFIIDHEVPINKVSFS